MAHQRHLEKRKYRQWVKAGLGLTYLREGLAPFCEDIAKQQQNDILDNIKQTQNLSTVTCGKCSWTTLRPDHAKGGNRSCMLGLRNCNCCNPAGKVTCPNKVCGAIYDAIVKNHGFTPPAPYWKNTETQHWCTDPWSIAKCFINAPGYDKKASAADIDCIGLLHLIRNNQYFHNHIQCIISLTDVFQKVITDRNEIFHSSTMQIEVTDANSYIDDMIAVLQDGKELNNRQDAQDAVKKLLELKKEDFIITTKNEADMVHATMQSVTDTIKDLEDKLQEKLEHVPTTECVENKLREKLANVPKTEDVESLETRVTILELDMAAVKEEMKELKETQSSQCDQYEYIRSKLEFQEKLMNLYRQSLLQVSVIPLKPERKHCNFSEVYVRPRMTHESTDEIRRPKETETEIRSMSEIFTKTLRSIYVIGDAGSGKSSFCKSLVNCWCVAHSGEPNAEDKFEGIKVMKKFEFLFYVSLRRFRDVVSIQEMLEKQYKSEILNEILNKESRNIIIVLDGLDEWSSKIVTSNQFQTEGLPERDASKDYTVLTTSRPWKIEMLGITDKEIEQRLKLKGFDRSSVKTMIDKTVPVLNELFAENKSPSACEDNLNNKAIASMKEVPIMLLQLICLWFDDKLQVSSRCALYSSMLELFFSWNDKKKKEEDEERLFRKMREMSNDLPNMELPQYLMNNKLCKMYKYLIHELSRLAFETLFTSEKEASLTFENSVFQELEISDEVKTSCLKLGLLSEDGCPSLYASTSDSSLLSFVHKSVQEYLAAVYIAIKLKAHIGSSSDSENQDFCAPLINSYIKEIFSTCTTLDEILEHANLFIILCGLEPRIAMSVSNYIYHIVTRDKRVLDYRRTTYYEHRHSYLISNIQKCILNSIEEAQVCQTNILSIFYVGDIIVQRKIDFDHFYTVIDKQYIFPDSVRSLRVVPYIVKEYLKTVLKYLRKCQRLESIHIDLSIGRFEPYDEDIKSVCEAIKHNTSTLKSLFLDFTPNDDLKLIYNTTVRCLPVMSHLVALHIKGFIMSHKDFTSLCTFVSGSSRLEQISISHTCCDTSTDSWLFKCSGQHKVDLSKHQQLQCLKYEEPVNVTSFNTSNLEIFTYRSLNRTIFEKVFDIISTANKLTKLKLMYESVDVSTRTFGRRKSPSYFTVTDKLIKLLLSLRQLRELTLHGFTLTDNIMKCPSEMKSMKFIYLGEVRMSLTTWQQFVDSLPLIPQPVKVETWDMRITRDGEEFKRGVRLDRGWHKAYQYVSKQAFLIMELTRSSSSINFSTKK